MKLRNLALVAAWMLFLAFTALAQVTAVEGDVRGADGKSLQGAVIKITRTDGKYKGNYSTKSNKKGHYFYNGLPLGTYTIAIWLDGKEVDQVNNVRTSPDDAKAVNFDLQDLQQKDLARQARDQDLESRTKKTTTTKKK